MTNPIYYQNPATPAYSGVTINITNPTLNATPLGSKCQEGYYNCCSTQPNFYLQAQDASYINGPSPAQMGQSYLPQVQMPVLQAPQIEASHSIVPMLQDSPHKGMGNLTTSPIYLQPLGNQALSANNQIKTDGIPQENNVQSYPPQYYL